jgi:hypothetical protein
MRTTPAFSEGATGFMDYPAGHVEGFPDTFKMLFRNVYQTIATDGKAPRLFATPEDGHQEVKVCEAVEKSHRNQAWVKVNGDQL